MKADKSGRCDDIRPCMPPDCPLCTSRAERRRPNTAERWLRGRKHRTRNAACLRGHRGFESHPLRQFGALARRLFSLRNKYNHLHLYSAAAIGLLYLSANKFHCDESSDRCTLVVSVSNVRQAHQNLSSHTTVTPASRHDCLSIQADDLSRREAFHFLHPAHHVAAG